MDRPMATQAVPHVFERHYRSHERMEGVDRSHSIQHNYRLIGVVLEYSHGLIVLVIPMCTDLWTVAPR